MKNNIKIIFLTLMILIFTLGVVTVSATDTNVSTETDNANTISADVIDTHSSSNIIKDDEKLINKNKLIKNSSHIKGENENRVFNQTILSHDDLTSNTIYENVTINAPIYELENITVINSKIELGGLYGNYVFYDIYDSNFINVSINKMHSAPYNNHKFVNVNFVNVTFNNSISGVKIDNATFTNCVFFKSLLKSWSIENENNIINNFSSIQNSRFNNCTFIASELKSEGECYIFENSNLSGITFINSKLNNFKVNNTKFENTIFNHTKYVISNTNTV